MLLLIGPGRDGRHNTYICRGSGRQIEPLGPDVFDVVSDAVNDVIKSLLKIGEGGFLGARGRFWNPWNPPLATPLVLKNFPL